MEIVLALVILIFSAVLHEVAHGYVADHFGDPTARLAGRLTLNPRSHIDPIMSILLPLMLLLSGAGVVLGAAKPVPIDPFNLKEGRKDVALVALAGPLTNLLLAILGSILLRVLFTMPHFNYGFELFLLKLLVNIVRINLVLAIFNLLPIPPLDGSKVFALILPEKDARSYLALGSMGMFLIFFLLLFPIGGFSLGYLISNLVNFGQQILLP